MSLERKQIFCADDWGMSPGINEGILELARKNLLWSVSLMANTDYVQEGLEELLSYKKNGLRYYIHFNLTYGRHKAESAATSTLVKSDGSFYNLGQIMIKSFTRQISSSEITAIFYHQVETLSELNVPLTGVDGHHHIHLFPMINAAVARAQLELGIKDFRLMTDPKHRPSYFQSLLAKHTLKNSGVNFSACGYILPEDIQSSESFEKKINRFEKCIVHPAAFDDFDKSDVSDTLREERLNELKKLLEYTR